MRISTTTFEISDRRGSDAESLKALKRAGFDACDFSMWHYPWNGGLFDLPEAEFYAYFTALRSVADACGLAVGQTHAPFPTSVGDAPTDADRLRVMRRAIRATGLLGAPCVVIHPVMHANYHRRSEHERILADNVAMYRSLEPDLARAGVKAALENMFAWDHLADRACPTVFSTAGQMKEALEQLGGERYCACLDIGHAGLVHQDPAEMIRVLAPWLEALHVHDNDGRRDLHQMPFTGTVNWESVARALREAGYRGNLNLEADAFIPRFAKENDEAVLLLMADTARRLANDVENAAGVI